MAMCESCVHFMGSEFSVYQLEKKVMGIQIKPGVPVVIHEHLFWDGVFFFVTCPLCGYMQEDAGQGVVCVNCDEGLLPSASYEELLYA